VAVFAIAYLYGLRSDMALISFAPLALSWDLVALAALCSLLNYAFRIIRRQRYLARLGRSLPLGCISLTYVAGFAFTVSPGKVGDTGAAMTALLAAHGYGVADALPVTIVCRVVTLWLAILIACLAILALRYRLEPAVSSWP
jgi:uncharacterized membrane protein YbhN (UPF0104 family)